MHDLTRFTAEPTPEEEAAMEAILDNLSGRNKGEKADVSDATAADGPRQS
jgi:hypothetical protein